MTDEAVTIETTGTPAATVEASPVLDAGGAPVSGLAVGPGGMSPTTEQLSEAGLAPQPTQEPTREELLIAEAKALRKEILEGLRTPPTEKEIIECDVYASEGPGRIPGAPEYDFSANMVLLYAGKTVDAGQRVIMKGWGSYQDDGKYVREDGSQRLIQFIEGHLEPRHARSFVVLRYLISHPFFGKNWNIDPKDPGGLWRFLGWVENIQVPTTKIVVNTASLKEQGFK